MIYKLFILINNKYYITVTPMTKEDHVPRAEKNIKENAYHISMEIEID